MHGAGGGAPRGNRNAWKHGRYSAVAIAERRWLRELLRESQGCWRGSSRKCVRLHQITNFGLESANLNGIRDYYRSD